MSALLERLKPLLAALFTGLLGIAVWLLLAMDRPELTEARVYQEYRAEHADETARLLGKWLDTTLQMQARCSVASTMVADERRQARDALAAEFGALVLYFDADVVAAARAFVEWEQASRGDDCTQLPSAVELRANVEKLLLTLRDALLPAE